MDVGILNGMFQRGLSLITKPKPKRRGRGLNVGQGHLLATLG